MERKASFAGGLGVLEWAQLFLSALLPLVGGEGGGMGWSIVRRERCVIRETEGLSGAAAERV